ncbi:MAG: hypothetical protein QOE90_3184 [Thermoplasmata archaeon]|jgi:sugar-specific transcriptional regulator TrmB|nr:hypothetical protein [Thermoplasmata archaeon]
MTEATLRAALAVLGMDARGASIYEHLGATGSQDAASVALGVGISKGQAYRALDQLVRRGQVAVEAAEPARYRAIDLTQQVTLAAVDEDSRAAALAVARVDFRAFISTAQAPRAHAAEWRFRPVTGRHAFYVAARRLILKARISVLVSHARGRPGPDDRARKLLDAAAEQRRKEGVRVSILTRPSPTELAGSNANAVPTFFIIDAHECLFLSPAANAGTRATWTNALPLVAIAKMLHDELRQDARSPTAGSQDVTRNR